MESQDLEEGAASDGGDLEGFMNMVESELGCQLLFSYFSQNRQLNLKDLESYGHIVLAWSA